MCLFTGMGELEPSFHAYKHGAPAPYHTYPHWIMMFKVMSCLMDEKNAYMTKVNVLQANWEILEHFCSAIHLRVKTRLSFPNVADDVQLS